MYDIKDFNDEELAQAEAGANSFVRFCFKLERGKGFTVPQTDYEKQSPKHWANQLAYLKRRYGLGIKRLKLPNGDVEMVCTSQADDWVSNAETPAVLDGYQGGVQDCDGYEDRKAEAEANKLTDDEVFAENVQTPIVLQGNGEIIKDETPVEPETKAIVEKVAEKFEAAAETREEKPTETLDPLVFDSARNIKEIKKIVEEEHNGTWDQSYYDNGGKIIRFTIDDMVIDYRTTDNFFKGKHGDIIFDTDDEATYTYKDWYRKVYKACYITEEL